MFAYINMQCIDICLMHFHATNLSRRLLLYANFSDVCCFYLLVWISVFLCLIYIIICLIYTYTISVSILPLFDMNCKKIIPHILPVVPFLLPVTDPFLVSSYWSFFCYLLPTLSLFLHIGPFFVTCYRPFLCFFILVLP